MQQNKIVWEMYKSFDYKFAKNDIPYYFALKMSFTYIQNGYNWNEFTLFRQCKF